MSAAIADGAIRRQRKLERRAKSRSDQREDQGQAPPASASIAVIAPSGRSTFPAWIINDFPSASLTGLGIAGVALAMFLVVLLQPNLVIFDVAGTHVAIGKWIVSHHAVPHTEPFSWWMVGQPWQASEWLSEVAMDLVFDAFGWSGLILFAALSVAATTLIIGLTAARKLGGLPLLSTIALSACVLTNTPSARPGLFVLPLAAAWVAGLVIARDRNRAPPFWLVIIMALWVNMHGSFIVGLFLLVPFAAEAVICASEGRRRQTLLSWGLFGVVALVAALANPYGFDALTFPFRLVNMKALTFIEEWMAPYLPVFYQLDAFLAALVGCALVLPLRAPPIRALIVIVLIAMTLTHVRHQTLLALITPIILAAPIARAIEQQRPVLDWRRTACAATLAVFVVISIFGATRLAFPFVRSDGVGWSESALKSVPPAIRSRRVFNDVNFGNYLIFSGVRPMIDDRVELYGDAQTNFDYRWLDANAIDWTLTAPDSPITPLLDQDASKWVRIYQDRFASVHVRKAVWDALGNRGS